MKCEISLLPFPHLGPSDMRVQVGINNHHLLVGKAVGENHMVLFTQTREECATVQAEHFHYLLGHPTCLMASGLSFLIFFNASSLAIPFVLIPTPRKSLDVEFNPILVFMGNIFRVLLGFVSKDL